MKWSGRMLAAVLASACLFGTAACARTDSQESRQQAALPEIQAPQSAIYVLNRGEMSDGEYAMAASLQGICAQSEACIYIEDDANFVLLEQYLKENEGIRVQRPGSVWELIREKRDALADSGCVLFRMGDSTINMAATIAGMER